MLKEYKRQVSEVRYTIEHPTTGETIDVDPSRLYYSINILNNTIKHEYWTNNWTDRFKDDDPKKWIDNVVKYIKQQTKNVFDRCDQKTTVTAIIRFSINDERIKLKKNKDNLTIFSIIYSHQLSNLLNYRPSWYGHKYYQVKCPKCNMWFDGSDYLRKVFDGKTLWLANLITHYRHDHTDWNSLYPYLYGIEYDGAKIEYNEKCKQDIIVNCKDFLTNNRITLDDFLALQNTSQETIDLFKKTFSNDNT